MVLPEKKGPSLSVGFLRHLGVEPKNPQGSSGRRSKVQSRKNDRKQARSKNISPGAGSAHHQKQTFKPKPQQSALRRTPGGGPFKGHTSGNLDGKACHFSRPPPSEISMKGQGTKDSLEGFDMSDEESCNRWGGDNDTDDMGDDDDDDGFDGGYESGSVSCDNDTAISLKVSSRVREKLAQDDVEIAELERKLGIKGRKTLPKAFKDDGLGDLMDNLDGDSAEDLDTAEKKKRKVEADEWFRMKRRKAEEGSGNDTHSNNYADEDEGEGYNSFDDTGDGLDGFGGSGKGGGEGDDSTVSKNRPAGWQRENPYVAPVPAPQKYVPPALRRAQEGPGTESETVTRVRKQAHHLIARLSDANILSILGEVDKLYTNYPRQYVTDAVVDKLLEQVEIEGALSSNVTILIAGFATAVYMAKGTDFGAHFIQQNAIHFRGHYDTLAKADATDAPDAPRDQHHTWAPASKVALNLFTLMAELYNFRLIGPNLIYDYVRMLLGHLTGFNVELLLRVFEVSGHRLHQDDPGALKGIVSLIQPAVARAGGKKNLPMRTRHMLDKISDLKKSDKKKHRDTESSGFGHAERMRKMLGTLPASRKIEASGPLHVSLIDLEQAGMRGKWWLVGASWAGRSSPPASVPLGADTGHNNNKGVGDGGLEGTGQNTAQSVGTNENKNTGGGDEADVLGSWADDIPDMEELNLLAREQGMNTDARRSIFVALLSAADSKDAHARLLRLGLNKHQKREVANVLIRCVGSEQHYNHYYALVARHVCSADRRMDWVFQASLWKLFRRLGEPMFGEAREDDEEDEGGEATDLRRVVNTAKMYGYLVACGSVSLGILKCLSLVRLQPKTRMFVEVLLLALFEEAHQAGKDGSSTLIRKRFASAARNNEGLRRGLQYFVDKVLRKSKLVSASEARGVVRLCDKAQRALAEETDA